jgi:hypothetical protein
MTVLTGPATDGVAGAVAGDVALFGVWRRFEAVSAREAGREGGSDGSFVRPGHVRTHPRGEASIPALFLVELVAF